MNNDLDVLLRHALTPTEEPNFWLNQKILSQVKEKEMEKRKLKKRGRIPAIIFSVVLALGVTSISAYASWRYLAAQQVADEMSEEKLTEAFLSESAIVVNETQSFGQYHATLISIVSGLELSEYPSVSNGHMSLDKTYAVVAIENADGTPMPDTSAEEYADLELFVSPLIKGYNPVYYNVASMHGGYHDIVEDGILYRLAECDNVEVFADCGIYLCVTDSTFYNNAAYQYDAETGAISRNEGYEGLNALFSLPIDAGKADPEKAAEYIESLGIVESSISMEDVIVEEKEALALEITGENGQGVAVAEYALQFVGSPYAWGGISLTEGADCSGFVQSIYAYFDISLPRFTGEQREQGQEIDSLANAQPGDLIFYDSPSHVAVYIGNGQIVHAEPTVGICVSEAEYQEIVSIRRIIEK